MTRRTSASPAHRGVQSASLKPLAANANPGTTPIPKLLSANKFVGTAGRSAQLVMMAISSTGTDARARATLKMGSLAQGAPTTTLIPVGRFPILSADQIFSLFQTQ